MRHSTRLNLWELDMKGTVLALAAVLTFGSTALGMSAMAAEWTAAGDRGAVAGAALATPGPAGQLWNGGTLPAIIVRAQAYSTVLMPSAPVLAVAPRRA
ncbi:MAG TPA: hypothetical protein VNX15_03555 [Gemmatimonadales bacterium]|jgi:hypothetical protein|nr:hypothetical protein [Gemmatimonadales bacterium]